VQQVAVEKEAVTRRELAHDTLTALLGQRHAITARKRRFLEPSFSLVFVRSLSWQMVGGV
jgi:hypothetical protein